MEAAERCEGASRACHIGHISAIGSARGLAQSRQVLRTSGNVVELRSVGGAQVGGGLRGSIGVFSDGSRRRMFRTLLAIQWPENLLALHLTYHWMPSSGARCKRDLDTFRRAWTRKWGTAKGMWKQEYQLRGVPHFHLVLEWPGGANLEEIQAWVSEAWARVVGQDEAHRKAGTRVEKVRSKLGVAGYLAGYLTKRKVEQHEVPEGWWTGRWWGMWGVKPQWSEQEVSLQSFLKIRRVVMGLRRSRKRHSKRRVKVHRLLAGTWTWSERPEAFMRLLEGLG